MHLRYPVHDGQILLCFIHLKTGMFRILTIFLYNIINRALNFFIGIVSRTYVTDFLEDNFNVVPFANDGDVIACFVNRNENEFVMK